MSGALAVQQVALRAHYRQLTGSPPPFAPDGALAHKLATEVEGSDSGMGVVTMSKLQGKVAVITGGTTGIGLATAKLFAKEGAYVFITGRRQKELDEAVQAIGDNVCGVQGDVAKLADLDRLYQTVGAKGWIDIIFANAGLGEFAPWGASQKSTSTRYSISM